MKEILFVILNNFADWESAFIAPALNGGTEPGRAKYKVKTLSVTKEPVLSIGGFQVLPDYDINTAPEDYAGIVLIGGMDWFNPEAELLLPLIHKTIEKNLLVAGICNASVFLGKHGFLDNVKHTSNDLGYLKSIVGDNYKGDLNYINQPAVRDGKFVTANGLAYIEFCKEILYALEADTQEQIEKNFKMYKEGIFIP